MKKVIAVSGAWALPFIAFAQSLQTALGTVKTLLGLLEPILITLAVLYFFWGLIEYIKGGSDAKEEGRHIMIWGVIALFVMVSVFGLVQLLGNTLGIQQGGGVNLPILP